MAEQGSQGYPIYVVKPYDEKAIKSIASPFTQLAARLKAEKASYTAKQQALRNAEATLYMKKAEDLDGIKTTGNVSYDKNMRFYMDEKVDQYVDIKNGMDSGRVDARTGARALQSINNQIDIYKRNAPNVLAIANYAKENGAGGNNTLSKLNDLNMEILFQKLLQGSGDLSLGEKDGVLLLKGKGFITNPDNKEEIPWEYDLNINEFEKLFAQEEDIIRTIPTKEDLGLEGIAKPLMAAMSSSGFYKQTKEGKNGNTSTVDYFNIDQIKSSLVGPSSGPIDSIIRGGDADTIWSDMFLKGWDIDTIKDKELLWDAASTRDYTIEHPTGVTYKGTMMSIMKQYLADEVISMIPASQQVQFQRDGNGDPNPQGGIVAGDKNYTWNKNLKKDKEEIGNGKALETLNIYLEDPEGSMQSTLPSGSSVTENAGVITVTTPETEETEASENTYDLNKERGFVDYYLKIRERKGMFKGSAIESQDNRQDFEQEVKKAFKQKKDKKQQREFLNEISNSFSFDKFLTTNAARNLQDANLNEQMLAYRKEVQRRAKELQDLRNTPAFDLLETN